jgi:uncharacterized protein
LTDFTPWQSLAGGALIGLAAALLMTLHGRVAGMTGILSGVIPPLAGDWPWRGAFLGGAIVAPLVFMLAGGEIAFSVPVPTAALVVGGVLVGVGIHFGNGCPSGHGICGLARLSPRSLVAVITFMATAFVTVYVTRHLLGG